MIGCAQAEMGPDIVAAKEAAAGVDPAHLLAAAGADVYFGAVRVASQGGIERPKQQPVAAVRRDVSIDAGRPGDGCHQQVQRAVAVEVADRQAARDVRRAAECRIVKRDVAELKRWCDKAEEREKEWGNKLWMILPPALAVFISNALTLLITWYVKK